MPIRIGIAATGILVLASSAGLVLAFQQPETSTRPSLFPKQEVIVETVPATSTPTSPVIEKTRVYAVPTERPEDVAALKALNDSFRKAFNAGDSVALSQLFTENAVVVDEDNVAVEGRKAISARFARSFTEHAKETIEIIPESLRFLGPDTAIEEGSAVILLPAPTDADAAAAKAMVRETSRYTVIYVKQNGAWLHASIHDQATGVEDSASGPVLTNYEYLKPLEWLVGDWVEEGSDVLLTSSIAWSDNRNYLIRNFRLQVPGMRPVTGTQRIGWDPSTRQIRSWEFDSDGSFGEGIWSRKKDNQWVAKMSGVRHDGRVVTDSRLITRTGADYLSWQAFDRTIGGEVQDDSPEYLMVRRAPAPGQIKVKPVSQ